MAHKNKRTKNPLKNAGDFGLLMAEADKNLELYYVGRERYVDKALCIDDPVIFIMGPKGIGKSAVLQMVRLERTRDEKRIINIAPDDLAFSALANLKIESPLLTDAVRGTWLFKSLWDYVLLMEIWERENSQTQNRLEKFFSLFTRTKDKKRIQRLFEITISDSGKTTTLTNRILELIKEIELSGQINGVGVRGSVKIADGGSKQFELLSEINSAVKTLPHMLEHNYYVLIDDLDLYWKNEPNQNAFIAALFLSLRKLSTPPIKFLVSIRDDIYNCLPLTDKDKSRDRICSMDWDLPSIKKMVEKRVMNATKCKLQDVWNNIFPKNGFEILTKFSTKKPREFIRMGGLCIERAYVNGHKRVLESDISEAIRRYSTERMQDIASELTYTYPGLNIVLERFRGKDKEFNITLLDDIATEFAIEAFERQDAPWFWAGQFDKRAKDFTELLADIGFLQVKVNRTASPHPYDRAKMGRINTNMWFAVHPMYAPGLELLGT